MAPSSRLRNVTALLVASILLVAGCGTRVSDDEVRAGVSAGPVQVAPESIEALKSVGAGPTGALPTADPGAPAAVAADFPTRPGGTGAADVQPLASAQPAATSAPGGGAVPTARCSGQEAPVPIGQIGSFSGVFGTLTLSGRTALAIWAKHVNATGGIACHPVTLFVIDDGADPGRAAAAVGTLATQHKVQALVSLWAPLSMGAMLPAIDRYQLPVVGGDSVAPAWNEHPLVFPQGAGLDGAVAGAVRQAVDAGFKKLGFLYCVESSLCSGVSSVVAKRAKEMGAELVYSAPVSLTQTDFTAQCQNAKSAGVQSFGMGVDGSTITRVVRSCAALNFRPQLISGAMLISAAQATDPGMRQNTLSVSTPNAPWVLTENAGQKEYAAALARYAPGTKADAVSLASWAAAKLFAAAVRNLGDRAQAGPLTSAAILTGLGKVKNETLDGLAPPITFSPGQKAAPVNNCVYYALLTERGWEAPRGNKYVCF